jgi:hypothetical protein
MDCHAEFGRPSGIVGVVYEPAFTGNNVVGNF